MQYIANIIVYCTEEKYILHLIARYYTIFGKLLKVALLGNFKIIQPWERHIYEVAHTEVIRYHGFTEKRRETKLALQKRSAGYALVTLLV